MEIGHNDQELPLNFRVSNLMDSADEADPMSYDCSVMEFITGLTDRARLQARLQEQRLLENLAAFRRAIENGEELD